MSGVTEDGFKLVAKGSCSKDHIYIWFMNPLASNWPPQPTLFQPFFVKESLLNSPSTWAL